MNELEKTTVEEITSEEDAVIEEETIEEAVEEITAEETEEVVTTGIELSFDPNGFTRNIDKMGKGMLGIFVVIGIIIIVTSILSKIKTKE